ncbi:MAG: thiamine pyrophosphate-dependent dehydrogenase E1 component subunit alpha [Promethearchaeota archaeon]
MSLHYTDQDVAALNENQLSGMYETVYKIRQFESKAFEIFNLNLIPGTLHLYLGEEAVATGICANLTKEDYVTSTHRGHGHAIAKGADLRRMMAELFGKKTGYCKGKGGSMHIADFDLGMLGANGVVGGGIPIAVGAGLSCKLLKNGRVVASFFGDGASNQGANFHGALNLAAIWDLPVVFVCENNLYAMGTPLKIITRVVNLADRAIAYGMPGIIADGMDVLDVYFAAKKAFEHARDGKGPTLIECKTYRIKGHSKYDPATYRPKKEVEAFLAKDAIQLFRKKLLTIGFSESSLQEIEKTINTEVEQAVKFAKESPFPNPEDALTDIYFKGED